MPPKDCEKSVCVTSLFFSTRRLARVEVNIPAESMDFGLPYYISFYSEVESDH